MSVTNYAGRIGGVGLQADATVTYSHRGAQRVYPAPSGVRAATQPTAPLHRDPCRVGVWVMPTVETPTACSLHARDGGDRVVEKKFFRRYVALCYDT